MKPSTRHFWADEELGKKDDDYKLRSDKLHSWRPQQWRPSRMPRRLLLMLAVAYLIYIFFHSISTDLTPAAERYKYRGTQSQQKSSQWPFSISTPAVVSQHGPPPRDESQAGNRDDFYYDGHIIFNSLGNSLLRFQKQSDRHFVKHAVVFAASSLRGVSDLLPLACRMANRTINNVHFVLMGRNGVSIEGIQYVNGIHDSDCPVHWHDSRPDYARWSTDDRMERAVVAGLSYVESYIHPDAIITQGESLEDAFFLKGTQRKTRDNGVPYIVLPSSSTNLIWLSTLDSTALRGSYHTISSIGTHLLTALAIVWNDVRIEILLHAPAESSGSLIRLIKSLENADYLGLPPTLTIELPPRPDPHLLHFLEKMKWPLHLSGKVTVRRRVRPHAMNAAESALRTTEAFYPRNPNTSHLLLLSPQVELAPSFYHYLLYSSLKYRRSSQEETSSKLLGISLELPSSKPTDNKPFTALRQKEANRDIKTEGTLPHFLWQAPNSNAAMYFGDKWAEFHSFLSTRLAIQEKETGTASHEEIISRKRPTLMEFILEFIRAKGYYMLYPSFPRKGIYPLATVHKELYHSPEEFFHSDSSNLLETPAPYVEGLAEPLTTEFVGEAEPGERPLSQASTIIPLLAEYEAGLPEISTLPLLSYRGERLSSEIYRQDTEEYARKFRIRYGGCHDSHSGYQNSYDLFCMNE
ncbi:hypothetical protein PHISCL_04082 [Aspergillus sclerotialis]|uniref:Uncharacterized protein n=1 Tax=Aspergillus sclerotialis TaxID=2070753 RepID=A0A3A2ZKB2_9EURO|nr:hypothetical protein PHISCL_04082 [Aspergillus sclerotialis]